MSDPLERRMVPCPKCENGKVREWLHNEYITVDCTDCDGTGQVLEPAEVWAERNARIAWWLAEHPNLVPCAECSKPCPYGMGDNHACAKARVRVAAKAVEEAKHEDTQKRQ